MWKRSGETLSAQGGGTEGQRRSGGILRARPSVPRSGSGAPARRGEPATMLSRARAPAHDVHAKDVQVQLTIS